MMYTRTGCVLGPEALLSKLSNLCLTKKPKTNQKDSIKSISDLYHYYVMLEKDLVWRELLTTIVTLARVTALIFQPFA